MYSLTFPTDHGTGFPDVLDAFAPRKKFQKQRARTVKEFQY
jgi:hypothetical protein